MRMRTRLVVSFLFAFLFFPARSRAATYYVRTDGGPPDRCTGLAESVKAHNRSAGTLHLIVDVNGYFH